MPAAYLSDSRHGNLGPISYLVGFEDGSDPTGTVDSFNPLQFMLDSAAAAGGGILQLPAGTFLISQTLQVSSNTQIVGSGQAATVIKARNSFAALQVGSNPGMVMICTKGNAAAAKVRIADLTLDMNEANIASVPGYATAAECSPIGIQNVTGLIIERVEIIHAIGYSIFPLSCTDVQITGCRILSGQANNGYSNQDGIHVTDCTAVRIAGNYIDAGTAANGGDDAIAVQGISAGCTDVVITGNNIERTGAHGINLVLGGAVVSAVSITGNVIKSTAGEGLLFNFSVFVASATYLITDVTVTGNVFKTIATANAASGITLQDAFGGVGTHNGTPGYAGVTIAGNLLDGFTNSTGFGIYAQAGSDLTISDNTLLNWGAVRGIDIGDNSSSTSRPVANAIVSGNTIDMSTSVATAPSGIELVDSSNAVITDNSVIGPGAGVASSIGISSLSISTASIGCVFNDNRVRAWATGISETNNGAAPDFSTFVGNNTHGCTSFISTVGTHDVVASNVVA